VRIREVGKGTGDGTSLDARRGLPVASEKGNKRCKRNSRSSPEFDFSVPSSVASATGTTPANDNRRSCAIGSSGGAYKPSYDERRDMSEAEKAELHVRLNPTARKVRIPC
jgi:hypothetical protein